MNQHGGYGDGNAPQWGQGQGYGYPPPPQQPLMQQGYAQPPQHYGYPPQQMMAPQPMVVVQQSQTVVTQKAPFNHGAHLVLTVLTCGVWLPIWIVLALIH